MSCLECLDRDLLYSTTALFALFVSLIQSCSRCLSVHRRLPSSRRRRLDSLQSVLWHREEFEPVKPRTTSAKKPRRSKVDPTHHLLVLAPRGLPPSVLSFDSDRAEVVRKAADPPPTPTPEAEVGLWFLAHAPFDPLVLAVPGRPSRCESATLELRLERKLRFLPRTVPAENGASLPAPPPMGDLPFV